jgi:DNA-binding CsgD family transcriptional regulator
MYSEHAFRHLEVLCRLPLGELAMLKGTVELLRGIVPADWAGGGLFLDGGRPGPGYGEHDAFHAIASRWHIECAADFGEGLTPEAMGRVDRVGQTLPLQKAGYEASPVYQKVFRPAGIKWFLDITVIGANGPLAGLMLMRTPSRPPFNEQDCQRLEPVRTLLVSAHSAARRRARLPTTEVALAPVPAATEHILLGPDGRLAAVSARAERLLYLLAAEDLDIADLGMTPQRVVERAIAELIGARRAAAPTTGEKARTLHNGFGAFTLGLRSLGDKSLSKDIPDAYHVLAAMPDAESRMMVEIRYYEPIALHLARGMRMAGLTPAQVHVGTLLGMGRTKPEIARDIGVKPSTIDDTVRKLYERLDVHSAVELAWRFAGSTPTSDR